MKNNTLYVEGWSDYELLDSGDNRKLERYGSYILIRPETQAIWKPRHPELWQEANAEFRFVDGKGRWKKGETPEAWQMSWGNTQFVVRLTSFKHTGIFPEQAANWKWLEERLEKITQPKVLNLFGYTGIASIVAVEHGANVTHIDASKQSNIWAEENARLSGIPDRSIRFLFDDALKFVEREVRRGSVYDGIILDPPAFGRGAKGEVWKIEEDLPKLLSAVKKILSPKPGSFFLLNGYAAGYSPFSFMEAVSDYFPNAQGEFGELHIRENQTERAIPSGIYVRFSR
jgi:23S rRNA (cytosine1962-C5)-methyltransferase